ncbi:uncharacterized protein LOC126834981 [Adelges cooleyi]|uniref:uncharacterized protein LOC126834981 n=1 Tax=Adelges cooleyi TaxID=133065 RepID=UPI0021806285|nr:uncharacterized protein LOC126834981 [Adelges cooleyi]
MVIFSNDVLLGRSLDEEKANRLYGGQLLQCFRVAIFTFVNKPTNIFYDVVSTAEDRQTILALLSFPKLNTDLFFPYYVGHLSPLILVNLISILCLVTQHAYEDINRELEELCHVQSKSEQVLRLSALMNDHWFLEDYVENLSNTFGPELMFVMMDTYMQMLVSLYVMIWESMIREVSIIKGYSAGQLFFSIAKFFYLCYRCGSPIKTSERTIFHLQHLSFALHSESASQSILKIFTIRVNRRQERVTASGFFDINMSLTAGVVLTYFLVLIQIQSENYKFSIKSNVNTSAVPCERWPCLITKT